MSHSTTVIFILIFERFVVIVTSFISLDSSHYISYISMMASTPRPSLRPPASSVVSTPGNRVDELLPGYYVHSKKLGEGGFGKVYLATHLKTNKKVAIKVMNKKKLGVSFVIFCSISVLLSNLSFFSSLIFLVSEPKSKFSRLCSMRTLPDFFRLWKIQYK